MTSRKSKYVADFETTTDPNDCRVWGYGLCDISLEPSVTVGTTIDDFMEIISREDCDVYFHNLKFDGRFILDWLFRQGYEHTTAKRVRSGEFSTLISSMNQFYSITVTYYNGVTVKFLDSAKKLPMSVEKIAEAFNLDIIKGEIDYHAPRPVDHALTAEEIAYIQNDVLIVARALYRQFQTGMTRMTVGADSLYDFKKGIGVKYFQRMYPVLPESMDSEIRQAYRGGFTYPDDRIKGKRVGGGSVYDVNSLYPFIMRERPLPYGLPDYFPAMPPDMDKQFIVSITLAGSVKANHIPCIQIKKSSLFNSREYIREINEPVTLVCTSVDLDLWQRHYDLDILSWNGGYSFRSNTGVFNEFIDKWMQVKKEHTGGLRAIAKLQLNSLYGKFATNPDVTGKVPVFEDDLVRLVDGEPETRDPVYTAVGCFITAHAREYTISAAQANYDTFAYADTDSLHLLTTDPPVGVTVDPDELGAWKHEYDFTEATFIRAKQYLEQKTNGETEAHFAGMSNAVAMNLTLDQIGPGTVVQGSLKQMTVPGGAVLVPRDFTL